MTGSELKGHDGSYSIQDKIAEGSYGAVYKALTRDGNLVAIKILHDDQNRDACERIIREIQIVISMNHENIIRILDYGVTPANTYWFAMPFMASGSLSNILGKQDAKITSIQAITLIRDIAAGLDVYHQQDGIHRDIKPENILIDSDGTPKLADFGVARSPRLAQGNMTRSALGTPNYMAPEVVQGQVCRQSDIYSLGIVLWELLHWKRHNIPLVPPPLEGQFGEGISSLYKTMVQSNPELRPDAFSVYQHCDRLIAQLQAAAQPPRKTVNDDTGSKWSWLLAAAVGIAAIGAATSNSWDDQAGRYRGANGQFRKRRWG